MFTEGLALHLLAQTDRGLSTADGLPRGLGRITSHAAGQVFGKAILAHGCGSWVYFDEIVHQSLCDASKKAQTSTVSFFFWSCSVVCNRPAQGRMLRGQG